MCGPNFLAVADGATPLETSWPDAGDFAQSALTLLRQHSQNQSLSLQQVWASAIEELRRRITVPAVEVSCAVAMVRENDGSTEIAVCGDCTAFIMLRSGRSTELRDERVRLLNTESDGHWGPTAQSKLLVRELMNKRDGYWILSTDPEMANHILQRTYFTREIAFVLIYTDGFLSDSTLPMMTRLKGAYSKALDDDVFACDSLETDRRFGDDACYLKATIYPLTPWAFDLRFSPGRWTPEAVSLVRAAKNCGICSLPSYFHW